jgi:hypothetical protein
MQTPLSDRAKKKSRDLTWAALFAQGQDFFAKSELFWAHPSEFLIGFAQEQDFSCPSEIPKDKHCECGFGRPEAFEEIAKMHSRIRFWLSHFTMNPRLLLVKPLNLEEKHDP